MRRQRFPAVVIGSGAAGLACARALADAGRDVALVTKTDGVAGGSSVLSQGGIAAALGRGDSPNRHGDDTLRAGAGLADAALVSGLVHDGVGAMRRLLAAGFAADRDANGALALGREGAHSAARVVHAGGDRTGAGLVATLSEGIADEPRIAVMVRTAAVEILVRDGRVAGVLVFRDGLGWEVLESPAVVLATGGAGALWQATTNPAEATADGLALAARAGAVLGDLEFVQFHPTALDTSAADGARLPLLTEGLRGAGARLVDSDGVAFMADEHPQGDLAPRDHVARAIWRRKEAGETVRLDLRPALAAHGEDGFPTAVAACRAAGFDPFAAPVPVTPAAHYHMGGVVANAAGRTTVPGLWACGEVANTGVHGANRLASNSLLEALVWARRVADDVGTTASEATETPMGATPMVAAPTVSAMDGVAAAVRRTMSRHVGIERDGRGLATAGTDLVMLDANGAAVDASWRTVLAWSEGANAVLAARLIALAALRRDESRGSHYRRDFADPRRDRAQRQTLRLADLETAAPVAGAAARLVRDPAVGPLRLVKENADAPATAPRLGGVRARPRRAAN